MNRSELRKLCIKEKSDSIFKSSQIWIELILFILFPFWFLLNLFNPLLNKWSINFHHIENKNKRVINQIIFSLTIIYISTILIILGVCFITIWNFFLNWLVAYLFIGSGLIYCIWANLIFILNHIFEKNEVDLDNYIETQIKEGKTPKIENKPFKEFIMILTAYKSWKNAEHKYYLSKVEKEIPCSWKNGYVVNRKQKIIVPKESWNKHFCFIGNSGSGKSMNILGLIYAAATSRYPIIVLDGKADTELEKNIQQICDNKKLKLYVWNLENQKQAYSPFKNKTRTQIIDMICTLFDYASQMQGNTHYYAMQTRQWITLLIDAIFLLGEKEIEPSKQISFQLLAKLSKYDYLENQLKHFRNNGKDDQKKNAVILLDRFDRLESKQLTFIKSTFDELEANLGQTIKSNGIGISDIFQANSSKIVLFQLASNITNDYVSKILMSDITIMSSWNEQQRNIDGKQSLFIIDEASQVIQTKREVEVMAEQFRSKKICLAFGFQEKSGIETGNKKGLFATILNNCSTMFIGRIRDQETVKDVADAYGTIAHQNLTEQTETDSAGRVIQSGMGSVRSDQEFRFHPNDIKFLPVGTVMFATFGKKIIERYPDYPVIKDDIICPKLKVDYIIDRINFEQEYRKTHPINIIDNKAI